MNASLSYLPDNAKSDMGSNEKLSGSGYAVRWSEGLGVVKGRPDVPIHDGFGIFYESIKL